MLSDFFLFCTFNVSKSVFCFVKAILQPLHKKPDSAIVFGFVTNFLLHLSQKAATLEFFTYGVFNTVFKLSLVKIKSESKSFPSSLIALFSIVKYCNLEYERTFKQK